MTPPLPAIGLAVTTIGRPALGRLLRSAAASSTPPAAVAVADQSDGGLVLPEEPMPFPVRVVRSSGGASRGRNDAVAALPPQAEVLAFPNDDSVLPPHTLRSVAEAFATEEQVAAVACALQEDGRPRFELPLRGALDRSSVWRAIEPATFVRRSSFVAVGGFRQDLGTGCPGPWQSGEGTDLLLRLIEAGAVVLSRPDLHVLGTGERRDLSADELVAKHRRYARGTGFVYREHGYPLHVRLRTVVAPWVKVLRHDPVLGLSLRIALARSLGRVEGLAGHPLPVSFRGRGS